MLVEEEWLIVFVNYLHSNEVEETILMLTKHLTPHLKLRRLENRQSWCQENFISCDEVLLFCDFLVFEVQTFALMQINEAGIEILIRAVVWIKFFLAKDIQNVCRVVGFVISS